MEIQPIAARQRLLRAELRRYQTRSNALAIAVIVVDLSVALGGAMLAVATETVFLKTVFAILSGGGIASLFVLGHDAAHGSLTSSRTLNAALCRLAFLPSLHNSTLWLIQHNRIHHLMPNVKGVNSWSPLSLNEYRAMAPWSRAIHRFYRGGFGMAPYYLWQRWWKHKFFPPSDTDPALRTLARLDFALLIGWLVLWLATLAWVGRLSLNAPIYISTFWGFVVPFIIWNHLMGMNVLLQHTHPHVKWYESAEEARTSGGQESRTVHVRLPRWYGLLGHEIMDHPAHHINPAIPFYHLHSAQARLNEVLGADAIRATFGPTSLRAVIRICKLYDYENHQWLDFDGYPTSNPIRPAASAARAFDISGANRASPSELGSRLDIPGSPR